MDDFSTYKILSKIMTEYREIEQDPDVSDSDMMDVIREMLWGGWSLVEYKWVQGVKVWVFQFG